MHRALEAELFALVGAVEDIDYARAQFAYGIGNAFFGNLCGSERAFLLVADDTIEDIVATRSEPAAAGHARPDLATHRPPS